jgi:ribosomal protein L11 methylase PrmA
MVASIVPYRIDLSDPPGDAFDTLVALGALDVDSGEGALAALMPDQVSAADVATALGLTDLRVSPAVGRDDESVWTLSPRAVRTRTLQFLPASLPAAPGALRMTEGRAFGTGLHPTTLLCLEALEDLLDVVTPSRALDVGTGSGILALAAVRRGVARAVGVDVDADALDVAAANVRLNGLAGRLWLVRGGPDAVRGAWPLIVANVRAAELMEFAPALVRRTASGGRLVLSGIPQSVAPDVEQAYRRLGLTRVSSAEREGWTALVLAPSW